MNTTKRKVVDSAVKNHKPFFINIGTYGDLPDQICPLFANLRLPKLQLRDRAFPNSVRIKPSFAPMLCPNFSFPRLVAFIQGVHKVRVHFKKFITLFLFVIEIICKNV